MKEYIMDTVSLRGVETIDLKAGMSYLLSQITADTTSQEGLSAFSVSNASDLRMGRSSTTINIGGLVDESSPIQPIFLPTANTIRFYTGQGPEEGLVVFYPGAERLTISNTGRVGINSASNRNSTLDVREGLPYRDFGTPMKPSTSTLSITQPFFKDKRGGPPEFGIIQFRLNGSGETDKPLTFSSISSGNDGITDSYEDRIANLRFYTNTKDDFVGAPKKHLEINGFENKTKIFTQLNLGNVPVFRDQTEAVEEGRLVNGDVYQDREQNLKIVLLLEGGERARIE